MKEKQSDTMNQSDSQFDLSKAISGQSLEILGQTSQELWRETNFDRFLEKFIKIQSAQLGMTSVSLFDMRYENSSLKFFPANSKINSIVPALAAGLVKKLEENLLKMNLKTPEARQGMNTFHIEGKDINFVLIGDPAASWQMMLWEIDYSWTPALRENARVHADFLVRQLQSGAIWFGRLDQTQALLYRDDLTGIFNNRYLEVALTSEIRRAQRFQSHFCLLFIDLDNFKCINDKFGHMAGSSTLKQAADVLIESSREVDSVIRYGGDEFIILLLGATPSTGLLAAERIRRNIEEARFQLEDGVHVSLTASIGVAAFPEHASCKEKLLRLADDMMYLGKKSGKNRVVIYKEKGDEFAPMETEKD